MPARSTASIRSARLFIWNRIPPPLLSSGPIEQRLLAAREKLSQEAIFALGVLLQIASYARRCQVVQVISSARYHRNDVVNMHGVAIWRFKKRTAVSALLLRSLPDLLSFCAAPLASLVNSEVGILTEG